MRRAFVACVAFGLVMVIVAVHFGFKDPAPPPPPPTIDAAIADAAIDAAPVPPDAAPPAKKHVVKPAPARPVPKPKPKPVIATPPPVIPIPGRCTAPNPKGCPATEPNVNRPCDAEGVHCTYGASCCPPIYVCNNGVFEAWFTHCQ